MQKTTFIIQKMDCAAEEQLIRLKLGRLPNIVSLQFDLAHRRLEVYHSGDYKPIHNEIDLLQLDATFKETTGTDDLARAGQDAAERVLLWQVLAINFFFFGLEVLAGFISHSMGLVGDSLDMLADSFVYGMALFAVGGTIAAKKNIARASGYFQIVLAVMGMTEVVRRFAGYDKVPAFATMIVISILALIGNAMSLYLLQKNKSCDAHMQASLIFTSNDVIINIGVIIAGALVYATNSRFPDLLAGTIIFFIVARGAYRILQLAK